MNLPPDVRLMIYEIEYELFYQTRIPAPPERKSQRYAVNVPATDALEAIGYIDAIAHQLAETASVDFCGFNIHAAFPWTREDGKTPIVLGVPDPVEYKRT